MVESFTQKVITEFVLTEQITDCSRSTRLKDMSSTFNSIAYFSWRSKTNCCMNSLEFEECWLDDEMVLLQSESKVANVSGKSNPSSIWIPIRSAEREWLSNVRTRKGTSVVWRRRSDLDWVESDTSRRKKDPWRISDMSRESWRLDRERIRQVDVFDERETEAFVMETSNWRKEGDNTEYEEVDSWNVEVTDTTGTGLVSRLQRFAELTTLKQVQDRVRWTVYRILWSVPLGYLQESSDPK